MVAVARIGGDGRNYGIAIEGIDGIADIDQLPDQVLTAARQAVNRTVDRARTMSAQAIRLQVAFPATYLNPSEGRLAVTQYATGFDLTARIKARFDATSLARFVVGPKKPWARGGLQVQVKPGQVKFMPRAFIFPLKNGNIGMAARTNGAPPPAAFRPKPLGGGLWLLYGPSVNQVFSGVREEIAPVAADFMQAEFLRLMDLNQ